MSLIVCSVLTVVRNDNSMLGCSRMNDSKSGANKCTNACVAAAARTPPVNARSRPADAFAQSFCVVEDALGVFERDLAGRSQTHAAFGAGKKRIHQVGVGRPESGRG